MLRPGKKYWFIVTFDGDVYDKLKADGYRPTLFAGNTEVEAKGQKADEVRRELQKYGRILKIQRT